MVTIRKASEKDIAVIQEIVQQTWPVTYGEILSQDQISYMLKLMYSSEKLTSQLNNGHDFYIAEENGEYFGFAGIELHYNAHNMLRLHKIYVLPSAQGKSVGLSLIKKIVDVGLAENQENINLNVNRYNKAKTFYEKLGFEVVKEENIDIGNGYLMEDFVMEVKMENLKVEI